jgi:hypothetical protein
MNLKVTQFKSKHAAQLDTQELFLNKHSFIEIYGQFFFVSTYIEARIS